MNETWLTEKCTRLCLWQAIFVAHRNARKRHMISRVYCFYWVAIASYAIYMLYGRRHHRRRCLRHKLCQTHLHICELWQLQSLSCNLFIFIFLIFFCSCSFVLLCLTCATHCSACLNCCKLIFILLLWFFVWLLLLL